MADLISNIILYQKLMNFDLNVTSLLVSIKFFYFSC